ncbi:putative Glycosyltransferase family 28 N-terminal domain-containing protein [Seiridium cardinale]
MSVKRTSNLALGVVGALFILAILLFKSRGGVPNAPDYFRSKGKKYGGLSVNDVHNSTLGFEKIFILSLPSRTDRRDSLTLAAALSDLDIELIDGVLGSTVPDRAIPSIPGQRRLPDPSIGSWRGHMNAIREVVRRNLSSALILEDDADWDVRIRDQLDSFALSTRALIQPLEGTEVGYADSTYPRPPLGPMPTVPDISFNQLPHTTVPIVSPYGDDWDVLWLGHCGMHFPVRDNIVIPKGRVVHTDPTVPQQQYLWTISNPNDIKEQYPNHTRVVHHVQDGVCSLGYAVSQKGARRMLYELGLKNFNAGFDILLRWFCEGVEGRGYHNCLTVQPGLFQHHRFAGPKSANSDISDHVTTYHPLDPTIVSNPLSNNSDSKKRAGEMGNASEKARPHVLVVCHALSGHLMPLIRIASGLVERGWEVSFLGPTAHRSRIEAAGADFIPLTGDADLNDRLYYEEPKIPDYNSLNWVERGKIDLRQQCLDPLVTQWENFTSALVKLNRREPHQQVIVIAEAFFLGIMPLKYGASLPAGVKTPRSICVSITVPALRSIDLPPFVHPLPFDQSPAGRERNRQMWEKREKSSKPLTDLLDQKLLESGATRTVGEPFLAGANYTCHEAILQSGVPGFEYPRCDWPEGFKFIGILKSNPTKASLSDPPFPWWAELKHNSSLDPDEPSRKKIILVAQGTVETNPNDLIIPTIQAFADRDDVLIVAVLGWKDAKLSDFIKVPSNARVADYLSYDAALEHSDVWVHNAGFGAINHGIAHGVPMVVAGEGMDKTENARRVAWSGIGVDLGTAKPSIEQVKAAIKIVLREESYTSRVKVLQRQSEELDCIGLVHSELTKLIE